MSSIDDAFPIQGHVDMMCDRVVALLKADTRLDTWTDGRIMRGGEFSAVAGLVPPFIIVSATDMQPTLLPSQTEELVIPIGILLLWEEMHESIPEGGKGIATVIHAIKAVLYADPLLTNGSNFAAERLNTVMVTGLDGSNLEEDRVAMVAEVRAEYRIKLKILTQEMFRC